MPLSNERVFWLTMAVFIPLAVAVILWRNSEWSLELRSLKDLRFLDVDGFIAPLFLMAAFPVMEMARALVVRFDICDEAYAEGLVALASIVFSVGFSLSAFRQANMAGKFLAVITLLACGQFTLLALSTVAFRR